MKKIISFDTVLLFILTIARVRIDTMAALATPDRQADLAKISLWWTPTASCSLPSLSERSWSMLSWMY
jgi:hypothetical protein